MNLKNKKVLVTGGSLRIGREIALAFAQRGARVFIHYHSSQKDADKLVRKLKSLKSESHAYSADFEDLEQVQEMAKKIIQDVGGMDILVNNASAFYSTPFGKTKEAAWNQLMNINLKAPFFLAQALAPAMKKRGEGRIINIADWFGLKPPKNFLAYSLTKAGLIALTQGLAKELAPEILVTAVCPGLILPPSDLGIQQKAKLAAGPLVKRWGSPADVAKMVVFLAESDFITGSYHLVEGGESINYVQSL